MALVELGRPWYGGVKDQRSKTKDQRELGPGVLRIGCLNDFTWRFMPTLPYGRFYGSCELRGEIPGFSIALMAPVLPPEEVPLHTHEDASFVLLLDGPYLSSAANAGSECEGPTLIYNPPRTTHRDRFKALTGRFLAISVSRESFRDAAAYAALPEVATSFTSSEIISTAQGLARQCERWEPSSPLLAEDLCLELLAKIARRVVAQRGKPPMWFKRAKELLHDQCADRVGIAEAAHALGVHPAHFSRSFRQFLRCTPGEYLTRCRLEKAVPMLRETNLPLAEAALQAGFFDQSHFSKVFKRHFGISPRSYRSIFRPDFKKV
jgi:AraC family transcriptional regulator